MNIELAPMEGLTTYIYRNAHSKYYGKMDKYYTPFISLHKDKSFSKKELRELDLTNNEGLCVVPQVITNSSRDYLKAEIILKDMGYKEVNINFGCPSPTVTTKGKGSGMLEDPEKLEHFLEEVFSGNISEISIKTRMAFDDVNDFFHILEIYERFPLKELIIHGRIREDYYKYPIRMKELQQGIEKSKYPEILCYNGDIVSFKDSMVVQEQLQGKIMSIMVGRGILQRPWLLKELREEKEIPMDPFCFREFHDEIYREYSKVQEGDRNILYRMKELWFYMLKDENLPKNFLKKIRKSNYCKDYEEVVKGLWTQLNCL